MILRSCPACSRKLKLADHLAGKQIRCPGCKHVFRVEMAVEEAVVEEPVPVPAKARPVPAPAQPRPAPPPPPEEDNPFAVTEAPPARPAARRRPVTEPEPEPEAVPEPAEAPVVDARQARRAAKRGAIWLQLAFLFDLIPYVIFAVLFFSQLAEERGRRSARVEELQMGMVVALSAVYLVPVIFLAVGATLLANVKGRGLVITACVMAFLLVPQLLVYAASWFIAYREVARYGVGMAVLMPLLIAVASVIGAVFSVLGGVFGLLTLGKPAVRAAYR